MPANLTPEYRDAELRLKQASTPEEKLAALRLRLLLENLILRIAKRLCAA
jgi:hypothetical protein